ncbi:zinc-binding alcohol dehydrogenase family protein [Vibrio sp. SS-MA-C1-2]|uniref:zinc-binding alcohol dehydrogenase family protein n=1 Tax=Vibrio sp. SS-MA-C1-2 TaxID=2908646 RepID=UPI001F42E6F9|nr:zinc-binding alcohol dehydrogenase family protein [Vibrio sp. SS-MA-C1-2]UJF17638.1 zinc-binding alcohol dehydrogenase family protein [Vibrio sp. SS-MA-C1-2]
MKAIGYTQSLPITDTNALVDIELAQPVATGHDILVKVDAISVNPVDYKIRQNFPAEQNAPRVLGWDAVGEVVAIGEAVTQYQLGDIVYYAGDLNRQGSNAEFQLVDERIVGLKPKSLTKAEAAALPLTTITAWELLFDHLNITKQSVESTDTSDEVILITGAAGGVGSIFVQIAKALTGATIIATASRESSANWIKSLGADYIVDHSKDLKPQIEALNIGQVTHVASLHSTDTYLDSFIDILAPFGKVALIDDPATLDVMKMKPKSLSLHIEFMFARSMFTAKDMIKQSQLLNEVASLIDSGYLKTTVGENLGTINAEHIKQAHQKLESGTAIGKIVLEGF